MIRPKYWLGILPGLRCRTWAWILATGSHDPTTFVVWIATRSVIWFHRFWAFCRSSLLGYGALSIPFPQLGTLLTSSLKILASLGIRTKIIEFRQETNQKAIPSFYKYLRGTNVYRLPEPISGVCQIENLRITRKQQRLAQLAYRGCADPYIHQQALKRVADDVDVNANVSPKGMWGDNCESWNR